MAARFRVGSKAHQIADSSPWGLRPITGVTRNLPVGRLRCRDRRTLQSAWRYTVCVRVYKPKNGSSIADPKLHWDLGDRVMFYTDTGRQALEHL
ncbi:MAG: hypothetical protein ACLR6J_12335 [Parabacteroides merdae]